MHKIYFLIIEIFILLSFNSCALSDSSDPAIISGIITDSSGKGLSDVIIEVDALSGKIDTKTSANGEYTINMPSGESAVVTYSKDGYTVVKKEIAFRGGAHKSVDFKMNTYSEDAYFYAYIADNSVKDTKGRLYVTILANVNYEFECKDEWIKCTKSSSDFIIEYDENKTSEERTATITFNAEYGISKTLKIIQEAGPVLTLIDYIGKDNKTNLLTSDPFITFSREVKLTSVTSSINKMDLTPEYSADKKTIYFHNIKKTVFSTATIYFSAESTNSEKYIGTVELKNTQN